MNPAWVIRTGRLVLSPVGWQDLPELQALKGDPLVFGQMLGGVRSPLQAAEELAQEAAFWAAQGVGMWLVREAPGQAAQEHHPTGCSHPVGCGARRNDDLERRPAQSGASALGLTGVHERQDGRGMALRFAFRPETRGHGLAREAAGAALRFAHGQAGLRRVVAVAREGNFSSRVLLGAIGMRPCDAFERDGHCMLVFESVATPPPAGAWR